MNTCQVCGKQTDMPFHTCSGITASQRQSPQGCISHHFACDCREESFKVLLHDTMHQHADEDSCFYNQCDTAPCDWCVEAEKLVGPITPYKNPKRQC